MVASYSKILDISKVKKFEWSIVNFDPFIGLCRPWRCKKFSFAGEFWYVELSYKDDERNFFLDLKRKARGQNKNCILECTVSFEQADGEVKTIVEDEILRFDSSCVKRKGYHRRTITAFTLFDLEPEGTKVLPDVYLTLTITLRKKDLETGPGFEKLSDDLNELMQSADDSDFTVKVQGQEFHLHRCILGARTPVFKGMLRHDMKEKTTGVVCIDDCEPAAFRAFVRYIYSGRVDELCTDVVYGVYVLADKYQVEELKFGCLGFILKSLSLDTFCDIVRLALTYNLEYLLEQLTGYFIENTSAIMQTAKWMDFLKQYPIQANELHLKALSKNRRFN